MFFERVFYMKFRITIMPSNGGAAENLSGNFTGNSFLPDSKTIFGQIHNPNNDHQSGIIILPEEITAVNFNISDFGGGVVSNTESDVTVRILGSILSHLEETEESSLSMKNLLQSYTDNKLNNLTNGLIQGMSSLGNMFSSSLSSTLSGMASTLTQGNFNLNNLYNNNLKNTVELAKWALEYGEATDYRDVVIETIISESVSKTYILPDMFAVKYGESMTVSNGGGFFEILLKQKRFSSRKIQIKRS